jgi:hypothetical protein
MRGGVGIRSPALESEEKEKLLRFSHRLTRNSFHGDNVELRVLAATVIEASRSGRDGNIRTFLSIRCRIKFSLEEIGCLWESTFSARIRNHPAGFVEPYNFLTADRST